MNRKIFGVTLIVVLALLLNACAQTAPQTSAPTQAPVAQPTQAPVAQPTQAPAAQATQPPQAQPTATAEITPTTPPEASGGKKVATFIWTEEFDTLNPYYTNEWFSQITDQLWDKYAWEFDDENIKAERRPGLVGRSTAHLCGFRLHLEDDYRSQ
jgi:hypothetical protein